MICIPIVAENMDAALAQLRRASEEPADLFELRLDFIQNTIDVAALLNVAKKPCIVTCRSREEGGHFKGDDRKRLALLREAAENGAAYIDVEYTFLAEFLPCPGNAKVIASYHNFDATPEHLESIVRDIETLPCDIVKFAVQANALADNLRVWNAMKSCKKPVIGLAMGELGEASRVLALRMGSLLTFGSLETGKESAPGQMTARDLAELYRAREITEKTKLYAVVGNPIAHSVSPEIHNAAFRKLGMDASYLRFRVDDLAQFLRDFECLDLQGISVTIPHKDAALRASVEVEPIAGKIGAVNTLIRTSDGWRGDNTDWQASKGAIERAAKRANIDLHGQEALLLGAGGAARGIAYALLECGCKLVISNRTAEKAHKLAGELGAKAIALEDTHESEFAVVANSTSVGMHPHEDATPIEASVFHPGMVAFDAVYNPRETRMLREAREQGAEIADGVDMFVGQAVRQFELWTGREAPVDVMEKIVVERLTHS